VAAPLVEQRH